MPSVPHAQPLLAVDIPLLLSSLNGRAALARTVAHAFLRDLPQNLGAVHDSLASDDLTTALLVAHRVRGNLEILRATGAARTAAALEEAARQGDVATAKRLVSVLREQLGHVEADLSTFLATESG